MTSKRLLEMVTVCVEFGDRLAQVAPHNRQLVDKWTVATRPVDEDTRAVCRSFSIDVVLCDEFDRCEGQGSFAKSYGINRALAMCNGGGWLLHTDADIALPYDLHQCLDDADLRVGRVYGCNRLCVPYRSWPEVVRRGLYSRWHSWLVEFRDRPPGCYVGGIPAGLHVGYSPIGFFQLWAGAESLSWGTARKMYPDCHGGAARTDVQFGLQWDRRDRHFLPEVLVYHLEPDDAYQHMGKDWKGRKSPRYCPPKASEAPGATY